MAQRLGVPTVERRLGEWRQEFDKSTENLAEDSQDQVDNGQFSNMTTIDIASKDEKSNNTYNHSKQLESHYVDFMGSVTRM